MDEQEQARLRVVAAAGGSAAHYEAESDEAEQQAANADFGEALARYRRSLTSPDSER